MIFIINLLITFFLFNTPLNAQSPTAIISSTIAPTPTLTLNPNSGLYINEFMPNPEDGVEWVELINTNNFDIQISGWKMGDSTTIAKTIPTTTINAGGLYVWELNQAYFNNGIDQVRLINNQGSVVDEYSYTQIPNDGLSWSKVNGQWCFAVVSKNQTNNQCYVPTNIPTSTPMPTSSPVPTNTPTPTVILTSTPTKTPTPTKKPTLTPTPTPVIEETPTPTEIIIQDSVLGSSTSAEPIPTPTLETEKKKSFNFIPGIFIGLGGLMLLTPLILDKIKHEK